METCFQNALGHFKHYRKYLPRRSDIKHSLKTQYRIYLSGVDILKSDALKYLSDNFHTSNEIWLQVAVAIGQKIEHIVYHTKHLPAESAPGMQFSTAATMLKVGILTRIGGMSSTKSFEYRTAWRI